MARERERERVGGWVRGKAWQGRMERGEEEEGEYEQEKDGERERGRIEDEQGEKRG